ncbi:MULTISPECIES: MCE family protein [Mycobacterium avium complex (MAC)]|uniref:MCE family protein n=1 Tax=Mycobacterium avium complex (MAC) TaxID=120793 RepID=UPI0001B59DB2|nr:MULTISPECIES: MCE family protein [Mycobacterium avium complex (MAC)]ETB21830.1 mammalian cell entry protein [Mycobacterium avium subsp. avium 11-4751]AYJ05413.1 MCE family protein [Mycobacterium avium]ETZ52046.1 mce related family protein [Mycobacterium sp. MAC_011194_8550]ETZ74923.1 mce related family protein [Mycobacterium sp. MAC_080597_8934]KDO96813.1 mammalian cell entry protein [Mycobacterium avium subsp. hominissuis A5]
MTITRDTLRKATALSLVLTLAVASVLVGGKLWRAVEKNSYAAYFAETNGLFVGDEVRILGVAVGAIDKIEPQSAGSKVTFSVDKKYAIPAAARAAVLSPSLVTARAIQLVPAYSGGPTLSPGAAIPLSRTAVPVEWDDFRKQLEKLTDALQPTTAGGVNSVGEFVNSAADNLRGQGDTARDTVLKLSEAISALGDHADDIFSTVRNLQLLVSALYSSSDLLASFNTNLAAVTTLLTNTPNEVGSALKSLDGALSDVRDFLAENREAMGVTVDRLGSITTALNDSRGDVKQILHIAPTVFQNFLNIYQPAQSAMTGILALNNFADIPQFICSSIEAASRARLARVSKLCLQYLNPIIKNRIYNYIPAGINPFVGTQARPSEITYSEDWLRPGYTPPDSGPPPEAPAPPGQPAPADQPPAEPGPPPNPTSNSLQVLRDLMLPTGPS